MRVEFRAATIMMYMYVWPRRENEMQTQSNRLNDSPPTRPINCPCFNGVPVNIPKPACGMVDCAR